MHKVLLSVLLSLIIVAAGSSVALALQSGGVEIGDLETVWYPPTGILNLVSSGTGGRGGRPVLLKVTNNLDGEHGFDLNADSAFAGPTSMHVKITLKPGETKYIGIPTSDLTYVTSSNVMNYKCHLHESHLGGQLLILTK